MRKIGFVLTSVLAAQDFVSAPVVGYSVQEARREVRVIQGVPGATHYSEAMNWPEDAVAVRTTPGHRWLLVMRSGEGTASVWAPEAGIERRLDHVAGEPSLVSISPSGAAAVFYWKDSHRLVVYAGLPYAPRLMADGETAEWAALAVNGTGQLVAGLTEAGELRMADRLIREARPAGSFGFFGDDDTLAVAEAGSDRVELIGGVREGVFSRQFLQLPAPVSENARFASGGAGWFTLTDPDARAIYRLSLSGEVRAAALEGVAMKGLEALRPRGSTLLAAPDGEIPRIVLSHSEGDQIFYLPTLAEPKEEPQQ